MPKPNVFQVSASAIERLARAMRHPHYQHLHQQYAGVVNERMREKLQSGEAVCITTLAGWMEEHQVYFLPPDFVPGSVDYCDAFRERWMCSIGRHREIGAVLAAFDGRFYGNPDYECLWMR